MKGYKQPQKAPCGVLDEPDSVYFKQGYDKPKIGSTTLKEFCVNRKLFYKRYVSGELDPPKKECFNSGHFIERALLYGLAYAEKDLTVVDVSGEKTKAYQKAVEDAGEDAIVLTKPAHAEALDVIKRAQRHPVIVEMLREGEPQKVFRVEMPNFYLQCKVDWWETKQHRARDMKTTACIYGQGRYCFDKQIFSLGYDVQAALYRLIIEHVTDKKPEWEWVAVEKQEPFDVERVWMMDQQLEDFEQYVTDKLAQLNLCFSTGDWENLQNNDRRLVQPPNYRIFEIGGMQ